MLQNRKSLKQFFQFSVVGGANVLLAYVIFLIGLYLGLDYPLSLFMGHLGGVLNSYIWNKHWTFEARGTVVWREFGRFFLIYLATFFLNLFLLYLFVDIVEMGAGVAQFLLILPITLVNFWGHKYISFRSDAGQKSYIYPVFQWIALVLMIISIMALPHMILKARVGDYFYFIPGINDQIEAGVYYGAYAQEFKEGKFFAADPFTYEYRDFDYYIRPPFFLMLFGMIQKLLSINPDKLFIFLNIIGTPVIFVMVYVFLKSFPQASKKLAIFGSITTIFALDMWWDRVALIPDFIQYLWPEKFYLFPKLVEISRLPSNAFTLLLYIAVLYCSYRAIFDKKRLYAWLAGLLFGLTFYAYFYLWMFFLIFYPMWGFFSFLRKEKGALKNIIGIYLIGMVLSIPHWFNFFFLKTRDYYQELGVRTGFIHSDDWFFTPMEFFVILLLLLFYPKKDQRFYFLMALPLTVLIGENVQVILGYTIYPDTWWGKFLRPTALFIGTLVLPFFIEKIQKLSGAFRAFLRPELLMVYGTFLAIIFLANSAFLQTQFALSQEKVYAESYRTYEKSLEWMRQYLPRESVVGGLDISSMLFPLYTNSYPFFPFGLSLQRDEEIVDRFLLTARIFTWTPEMVRAYLGNKVHTDYLFAYKYNKSGLAPNVSPMSPEEIESVVSSYREILASSPKENPIFKAYRIDYVFIGPDEHEFLGEKFSATRMPLYKDEFVTIYKVHNLWEL